MFFHDADHVQILAVNHYLLTAVKGFGQKLFKELPFSGLKQIVIFAAGFNRCRVVANLLEQGEQGKYMEVGHGGFAFSQKLNQILTPICNGIPVELHLILAQAASADVFDFGRQFAEYRCFKPAQGKRRY